MYPSQDKSLLPHQWHGQHERRLGGAEPIFQGPCFHVIGPGKVDRDLSRRAELKNELPRNVKTHKVSGRNI